MPLQAAFPPARSGQECISCHVFHRWSARNLPFQPSRLFLTRGARSALPAGCCMPCLPYSAARQLPGPELASHTACSWCGLVSICAGLNCMCMLWCRKRRSGRRRRWRTAWASRWPRCGGARSFGSTRRVASTANTHQCTETVWKGTPGQKGDMRCWVPCMLNLWRSTCLERSLSALCAAPC